MRRRMMRVQAAQQAAAAPGAPPAAPPETYILLGGDDGSPPIKLKESDGKRIQEETEQAPEDLEDADLAEAMQELGIQSQPLTDADRKQLGLPPAGGAPAATPSAASTAPPAAAAAPAPPAPAGPPSVEAQLQQLANLRDKGLITPEDYEAKKKQILGL